jgi:hypothetical protein
MLFRSRALPQARRLGEPVGRAAGRVVVSVAPQARRAIARRAASPGRAGAPPVVSCVERESLVCTEQCAAVQARETLCRVGVLRLAMEPDAAVRRCSRGA